MRWLKTLRITFFTFAGLLMVPFVLNCFGTGVHLSFVFDNSKALAFGAWKGACYHTVSRGNLQSIEKVWVFIPDQTILFDGEKARVLLQGSEGYPVLAFSFSRTMGPGFSQIRFPWLLIPGLFLLLGVCIPAGKRSRGDTGQDSA